MFNFLNKYKRNPITGTCRCCGKCCKNLILINRGKPVRNIEQFNKLKKKKNYHERFRPVFRDAEDNFLYFSCDRLDDENKCSDYQHRPEICREYPNKNMIKYGGRFLEGCGYRIKPAEDFKEILSQEMKKKNYPD